MGSRKDELAIEQAAHAHRAVAAINEGMRGRIKSIFINHPPVDGTHKIRFGKHHGTPLDKLPIAYKKWLLKTYQDNPDVFENMYIWQVVQYIKTYQ